MMKNDSPTPAQLVCCEPNNRVMIIIASIVSIILFGVTTCTIDNTIHIKNVESALGIE